MPVIFLWMVLLFFQNVAFAQDKPAFLSDDASYIWPTDASDYISATFAETRAAHFHAGIDIGTWGQEGFDVYASRDGMLYRVGISPKGYGNVIYLQHSDSSFTVYAHLQDFNSTIRALVDSVRFQSFRHSFDEILIHKQIAFKQGEIIGRTGSTGIGPPHLHFEVRSPSNTAINPKLVGIHIPDSVNPIISALAIEPLSMDATVNGRKSTLIRRSELKGNRYDFGTVDVVGVTGLSVSASDRADNGRNVYAVYELSLEVNGERYFVNRVDSFPMQNARKMLIDRVFPLLQKGRGAFQRLYIKDGNNLPFYTSSSLSGKLDLPQGIHSVKIIAKDFYGNKTEATVKLRVSAVENHKPPKVLLFSDVQPVIVPSSVPEKRIAHLFDWTKHWFSSESTSFTNLQVRSIDRVASPTFVYDEITPHQGILIHGETVQIRANEFAPVRFYRIDPGSYREINYPETGIRARFFDNSVFDTLYVNMDFRDQQLNISPTYEPLQSDYELIIELPDSLVGNPKVGLYHYNTRRKRFDFMGSQIDGTLLTAQVNRFGRFDIRTDTTGPVLSRPSIWRRKADGQWFSSVRAYDLDSGIDFNNIQFLVNGVRGIAEYDPFGDVIRYHKPDFQPIKGENILELRVSDYAGNVASERYVIVR